MNIAPLAHRTQVLDCSQLQPYLEAVESLCNFGFSSRKRSIGNSVWSPWRERSLGNVCFPRHRQSLLHVAWIQETNPHAGQGTVAGGPVLGQQSRSTMPWPGLGQQLPHDRNWEEWTILLLQGNPLPAFNKEGLDLPIGFSGWANLIFFF